MAFDGIVMAAVKDELARKLVGGRIEKIYQPEKDEVILSVHNQGEKYRLLISANSQDARLNISTLIKENPLQPPMFCMVLRKHLEGGRIRSIAQPGLERIMHIRVDSHDELGQPSDKILIIEIMGKHSNIILTDSKGTILDGINRYSHALSRHREVLPGRLYIAPPEQHKLDLVQVKENDFRVKITEFPLETRVSKGILSSFSGISPLMSREICARAGLAAELRYDDCGDYELHRLWEVLANIANKVKTGDFSPAIYFDSGRAIAFSSLELLQYDGLDTFKGSMSEVLDRFYNSRLAVNKLSQQQNSLLKVVNDELTRNYKKIALQEEAIAESQKGGEYKIWGELLTANLYRVQKGQESVEVDNFYEPGKTVIIPLNTQHNPAQNAQDYFRKYNKAKSTFRSATYQKELAQKEVAYLESVQHSITQTSSVGEINEIREELIKGRYLKAKPIKNKKPGSEVQSENKPLSFLSRTGINILVGKNNRQNDLLTLKMARENDIWLHVKDIPGSHVIIKANGQPVSDDTLLEAAKLAAYHSRAKDSSNVPVDYAEKKYVHKPNGAKPGMVIYTNQKTIFVTPEKK